VANRFLSSLKPKEEEAAVAVAEETPPPVSKRFDTSSVKTPKEKPDSFGMDLARKIAQVPLGFLQRFTFPADIIHAASVGEGLAEAEELPERIEYLKTIFPGMDWSKATGYAPEQGKQLVQEAGAAFPTQSNIEAGIESATGAPLTPKTEAQRLTRLGTSAAAFRPGTYTEKAAAGLVAPAVAKGAKELGAPEPVADVAGFLAGGATPAPRFTQAIKPSGMPARRYEKLEKPTRVSAKRYQAVEEAIQQDFKQAADEILGRNETYQATKEQPNFKHKIGQLFDEVETLAERMTEPFPVMDLRDAFKKKISEIPSKGITSSEYEDALKRYIGDINRKFKITKHKGSEPKKGGKVLDLEGNPLQVEAYEKGRAISAKDLVDQYRKNNGELRELFEPGKSSAYNRGKKQALLDYNEAISDLISRKYPESNFERFFLETNKQWQHLSDLDKVNNYFEDIFSGGLNYRKARQFFEKDRDGIQKATTRLLGKDGAKSFETLMEDFVGTEKAHGYLKNAASSGYGDLATHTAFLVSPKVGIARLATKYGPRIYQVFLDKPQLLTTWHDGIQNLKQGKYAAARKLFITLDKEISASGRANPKQDQRRSEKK
jgi:hypothetical protein